MASPPPTKPPRGVKPPKETSGLLMSVIRTLSASESNEQRDRERAKLEKEYKKSDKQIEDYVSVHHEDLTQIMQLFARLSSLVSSSKERITTVRENLQACKVLLSCRHEELKRLWLEGVEHKHMIQLLEDIEQIKEMPSKVNTHMGKKQYLTATRLLISAMSVSEGSLNQVEALKQIRGELQNKKQQLTSTLLQELASHIYLVSTRDIVPPPLRRQGSGRGGGGGELSASFSRGSEQRTSQRLVARNKPVPPPLLDAAGLANGAGDKESKGIEEDLTLSDPEVDSAHFIRILIECLSLLNKLPDAVEKIKSDMESQLTGLIARTTQDLLASSDPAALVSSSSTSLVQLLSVLMEQFKAVLGVHRDVVLKYIRSKSNLVLQLYSEAFVWSSIQKVLQALLTAYLSIRQGSPQPSSQPQSLAQNGLGEDRISLSSYYARKKPVPRTKKVLFKFEQSSTTVQQLPSGGVTSRPGNPLGDSKTTLLVKPDPAHITTLYTPLVHMIEEFEALVADTPGSPESCSLTTFLTAYIQDNYLVQYHDTLLASLEAITKSCSLTTFLNAYIQDNYLVQYHDTLLASLESITKACSLSTFLNSYIQDNYLVQYHDTLLASLESITKSSDAWRAITSVAQASSLVLPRPLLQSVVRVEEKLQQVKQLMDCLPGHTSHVHAILVSALRAFHDTCHSGYRGIVQPDPEDQHICSAAWLKDADICRFLKGLPNWLELEASRRKRKLSRGSPTRAALTIGAIDTRALEESAESIRERNIKEAEMLAQNLSGGAIGAHEIISDVNQLKCLAQLQESMEWFSLRLSQLLPSTIPHISSSSSSTIPQIFVTRAASGTSATQLSLESQAAEFLELAHTSLLVLHLEVRVQCFHYLLPKKNNLYTEPRVIELSRSLASLDEAMSTCLQPEKSRYIFEGIGDMIGKILMSSVQHMTKVDQSDINKMGRHIYTLQQSIASITMSREISLDQARRYFLLLTLTPDEILNEILETGPQYTDLEYMHALQLIHRSRTPTVDPNIALNKLSDILAEMRRKY